MNIAWKLIKFLMTILCLFCIAGFLKAIVIPIQLVITKPTIILYFILGTVAYIIMWIIWFSKKGYFWSTLEHELTHAFFALIFFKKIHSISASRKKGGLITIEGGNAVIALSPYFFPLWTFIVIILKWILPVSLSMMCNFIIGYTYTSHILNLLKEYHPDQPDLKNAGLIFSIIFVLFVNIIVLGIILSVLLTDDYSVINFLHQGLINSIDNLLIVFNLVRS